MLVLSRKPRQRIYLSGGIVIEVVEIQRGWVRIGITAPDAVEVLREELLPRSDPRLAKKST